MPGIQYQQIIVPVDGSESANRAAAFAANLAYCSEAALILLHVLPEAEASTSEQAEQAAAVFQRCREAMLLIRRALSTAGTPIEERVLRGDPAKVILDLAQQQPEAMIVMGRRGLSRVRELLLGSVSEQVLRQARCPVTLVP